MPYDRILELTSPEGSPSVHLLGTYAKRLTVYTQQIRAVNLVEAIHWYKRPLRGARVAVVGAGAAGITAAAHAVGFGAKVTLIERLQSVLEIQNKSERWLHPTLYEWPFAGLDPAEDRTELPVMNWSAATAEEVAKVLTKEWDDSFAARVTSHFNSEVFEIADAGEALLLRWRREDKNSRKTEEAEFDEIIFSVGFGLEPKGLSRTSYWENDSLDKTLRAGERVLIGGYGDGALTDLMRACLNKFDHCTLLTSVVSGIDKPTLGQIRAIETDERSGEPEFLTKAYRDLRSDGVQNLLRDNLNALRKVVLTGQGPHLFDPRASTLNRLIASQLFHLRAFDHIPIAAQARIGTADAADPVFAEIQEKAGGPFTGIVLRFGVERTITKIAGLPRSIPTLERQWQRIPAGSDPTRARLWARFLPISEHVNQSAVLFLSPVSDEDFLQQVVGRAIDDVKSPLVCDLRLVHLANCFRSDEALAHTVRALCRAPVVIFALGPKMGRQNIGGMLLMGVRAAVRRGATIVVREGSIAAADWSDLPFNLKELQVYGLDTTKWREGAALLTAAIREGLAVLGSDAQNYRDMPVFDIVRRPTRRTEKPAGNEREVFVLCSFAKAYDESWQKLLVWLDGKDDGTGGVLHLKRVIDYTSPLLTGERLYELTRHAGTCLIDWTDWSPNVFFEMGVRLAVAPTLPVCVLRHDGQKLDGERSQLFDRFRPLHYQRPGETPESFRTQFLDRVRDVRPDLETIYSVAERNMALQDEYGGRPLHEQLFAAAQAMVGSDPANLRLLYGRNVRLRRQVLQSAIESLTAAQLLIESKLAEPPAAAGGSTLGDMKTQIESLLPELEELLKDLR